MQSFERQMSDIIKDRERKANMLFVGLVLRLFNRIIRRTPVDTGRAKSNWNFASGSIDETTTEEKDKTGGPTIARAVAGSKSVKLGDTVYISNSLDYIRALEYGRSKKSPQGMVRVTVAEIGQALREASRNG